MTQQLAKLGLVVLYPIRMVEYFSRTRAADLVEASVAVRSTAEPPRRAA